MPEVVDAETLKKAPKMSTSSSTEVSSEILETYLVELKKVIEWLINSETLLNSQSQIANDVNTVKQQFQVHEVQKSKIIF